MKLPFLAAMVLCQYTGIAQTTPNSSTQGTATQTVRAVPSAYSSSYSPGFVRSYQATRPLSNDSDLSSASRTVTEVKQTTQYIDGLGRPLQTVSKGSSPGGYDQVSPVLYDSMGRTPYQYLPYTSTSTDGSFKTSPFSEQSSFYKNQYGNAEQFFYGKTTYEASPLNRVSNSCAPGNSWAGSNAGTTTQYSAAGSSDSVVTWKISSTSGSTPSSSGYYKAGTLYKTITTDEASHQVIEYKDLQGFTVLKKVQLSSGSSLSTGHTGWLCTYYVYDDFNNLRFVLQPKATDALKLLGWSFESTAVTGSAIAKELCFVNEYDARKRVTMKRVPGAGETDQVYDKRDRLVLMQDSALRAQGKWLYTDYDSLNRPVLTGLWTSSSSRSTHQTCADTSTTYPNPTSNTEVLTQTYYDDYSWVTGSGSGLATSLITANNSNTAYFTTPSDVTAPYARSITQNKTYTGLVTGTKTKVLGTTNTYLYAVHFYDDRGRLIQTQSTNHTGGKDTVTTQYSFSGQVLNTLACHGKGGSNAQAYRVLTQNSYDAAGRLTATTKTTGNSAAVVIASNSYDELGRLKQKQLGRSRNSLTDYSYSTNPIDSLTYSYNIRGWLRGINAAYARSENSAVNWFGEELCYDYGFSTVQLNGNIAGQRWRSRGDGEQRAYGYSYDNVNRLLKADFTQYTSSSWNTTAGLDFSLTSMSYDANGNILNLSQKAVKVNTSLTIDSLVYSYNTNSNKLNDVTDKVNDTSAHLGDFTEVSNNTTQDYWYDGNGNLTKDNNKSISTIHYNYLNQPDTIKVTGKGTIKYLYDAAGNKLEKTTSDSTGTKSTTKTDYVGSFVYSNDTLQYIGQEEGRIRPATAGRTDTMYYDYFEKDHLGNTRIVLTDERQQDTYPAATLESTKTAFTTEQAYYTINTADTTSTSKLSWWTSATGNSYTNNNGNPPYNNNPSEQTTATSKIVYKLNGSSGDKTGLGIMLKVMSGDVVDVYAKSAYHLNTGQTPSNTNLITSALTTFISAIAGTSAISSAGKGATATTLSSSTTTTSGLKYLLDTARTTSSTVPKAAVNWILLDEQFKPVTSNSGYDAVNSTGDVVKTHTKSVSITKSGYLYVYCSNESNIDVFFDNLQVIQTRSPLLAEDHYSPWGLQLKALCSSSAGKLTNRFKYNGKELQNSEFSDGSGLEWYDYGAREYDHQVGIWHVIDPLADKSRRWSGYTYAYDNPIIFVDPDGMQNVSADGNVINGGDNSGTQDALQQAAEQMGMNTTDVAALETYGDVTVDDAGGDGGDGGGDDKKKKQAAQSSKPDYVPPHGSFVVLGDKFETAQTREAIDNGNLDEAAMKYWSEWLGNAGVDAWTSLAPIDKLIGGVRKLLGFGLEKLGVSVAAKGGMTELKLVTKAAQKAEAAIGGSGGAAGTLKHTYAKNLLSRYQSIYGDRGLSLGSNYFNGPAGRGFLDVVNHNTMMIYDFKFGNAFMSNAQYSKYLNSFPGYGIQIIKP